MYNTKRNEQNKKHQSTFHMQKNITQSTRAQSTRRKVNFKTPERVPHAEKYSTKYQSVFHTRENLTQNTRARSTREKI